MICKINDCLREVKYKSLGVCYPHYKRWWRHGSFDYSPNYPNIKDGGVSKNGYKRITRQGVRILEHRHLVEKHIGRKLGNREIIHHINKNKLDNRIENLVILSQSEHMSLYHPKKPLLDWSMVDVPKKTTKYKPHNIVVCLINNCDFFAKTRGLCEKHYVSYCRNFQRCHIPFTSNILPV